MIILPARPHDDLNWKVEREIDLFEFDLGLQDPYFPIEDELHFQSLSLALTHFTKNIWPLFPDSKAILYRGSGDFSRYFRWSETQEDNFISWKQGRGENSEEHLKRLFCAETFGHYFQMLAHRLPDELPLSICLTTDTAGTLAQRLHLLSPERFEHFQVESDLHFDSNFGICFPLEDKCNEKILHRIDRKIGEVSSFRAVYESNLTESWDGLDEIYVFSDAVSTQGKRKLLGFCAAGGTVITEGNLLGLPNEVRGRGI